MVEEIVVNNRKYTLSEFHGEVIDQQVSETSFSSSSSHRNEHGQHVSSRVSGTRTTKEFFLVNKGGEERAYSFTNLPIPSIRPGHVAQVIYVKREGTKDSHCVLVRNVTLNTEYFPSEKIEELCNTAENLVLGLAATAIGCFFAVFCLWRLFTFFFLDAGFSSILPIIIAAPISYFVFKFGRDRFVKQKLRLRTEISSKII